MKANGSRREEKGGKNITEKIRCVPRSGAERKTVGRAVRAGGGRGWVVAVDAGGGRWAADACAWPAPGVARPHFQRLRRSSPASPTAAALPLAPTAGPRRATITRVPLSLYVYKVNKSVLPNAIATVLPLPIY